jgi:hypothetical protein
MAFSRLISFNGAVAPWGRYREFHGFQVAPQRVGKLSQEPEMRSGRRLNPGTQFASVSPSQHGSKLENEPT